MDSTTKPEFIQEISSDGESEESVKDGKHQEGEPREMKTLETQAASMAISDFEYDSDSEDELEIGGDEYVEGSEVPHSRSDTDSSGSSDTKNDSDADIDAEDDLDTDNDTNSNNDSGADAENDTNSNAESDLDPESDGNSNDDSETAAIDITPTNDDNKSLSSSSETDSESQTHIYPTHRFRSDISLASILITQVTSDALSYLQIKNVSKLCECLKTHKIIVDRSFLKVAQYIKRLGLWREYFPSFEAFKNNVDEFAEEAAKEEGGEDEWLTEEEYEDREGDRAYLVEFLEGQLRELREDVEGKGLVLGKGEVEGIVKGREIEIQRLDARGVMDLRFVIGRKRVKRGEGC